MSYFDDDDDHDHDQFSDHSDFNRRILIMAIVSLTVVLVLVFALHLYARFILRRQSRRRNAIHLLTLNVAHHHAAEPPPNTGLDPALIATLIPSFPFKQQHDNSVQCSVCLSLLQHGELLRLLPNCKHTFHVACIDTWLASHSTCPLCRTIAQPPPPPPQHREGPTGLPPPPPLFFEATSDGSPKIGSSTRMSSFRRILSRERSSSRIQPSTNGDNVEHDLESQH